MLVLSRQRDETIMIGDSIEITIVDVRGDKVRLGIDAPRSVQVHRKEVYDAIMRENTQATKVDVSDLTVAADSLRLLRKNPWQGSQSTDRRTPKTLGFTTHRDLLSD